MRSILTTLATLLLATASWAQIYQCSPGKFSDKPCEDGEGVVYKEKPPGSDIKINFNETTSHFSVSGHTLREAFQFFRAQEWAARNQMSPPTVTSSIKPSGKNCELADVTITVTNNNHMPIWPYYAQADAVSKKNWDNFYQNAVIHENGHRAIAREYIVLLREEIGRIGPKPCNVLTKFFNEQQAQAWLTYRERQRAYDRRETQKEKEKQGERR